MNVETLRTLLGMLPQDAEVAYIFDRQFRGDVNFVGYTQDGLVRLVSQRSNLHGSHVVLRPEDVDLITPPTT